MKLLVALVPLLAVALAQEAEVVKSEEEVKEVQQPSCEDQCQNEYSGSEGDEKIAANLKACNYGCRLLAIHDSLPFVDDLEQSKASCERDCGSQQSEDERYACRAGCGFQVPVLEARKIEMESNPEQLGGPLAGLFGGMPRIRIAVPVSMGSMMPRMGSMMPNMPSMDGIGDMFSRMHGEMDRMMKSLTSQVDRIENGELPEGSGRLVVVKSGPGFHHQKTYDFGPDGVETKTEERTSSSDKESGEGFMQDMMSAPNPLERFFNFGNDVEMIKPKTVDIDEQEDDSEEFSSSEEEENEEPTIRNPFLIAKNAFQNLLSRTDAERKSDEDIIGRAIDDALHKQDVRDGPRLPDQGIRQPDADVFVMRRAMCAQRSEDMKWSDWVTCLHLRMGLPRWLTAATISLGIVFVIWLCLVIPQNAPKQKVRMTKAMESQVCFANVNMEYPLKDGELPPAYEDIADLHVAISASHESKRKEAEAASAKLDTMEA